MSVDAEKGICRLNLFKTDIGAFVSSSAENLHPNARLSERFDRLRGFS
jgi:hypothetical protein